MGHGVVSDEYKDFDGRRGGKESTKDREEDPRDPETGWSGSGRDDRSEFQIRLH